MLWSRASGQKGPFKTAGTGVNPIHPLDIAISVRGILLAMAVGRQYEDTFSGIGQFLPVASIGSVKYGKPDVETGVSRTYRDRAWFSSR